MSEMKMLLGMVVVAFILLVVFAFASLSPRETPVKVATESQFIRISPEILLELKPNGDEVFYTGRVQCKIDDLPIRFVEPGRVK